MYVGKVIISSGSWLSFKSSSVTYSTITSSSVKFSTVTSLSDSSSLVLSSKISDITCSVGTVKSRKGLFLLMSFINFLEISTVSLVSFLSNRCSSTHMSSVPKFWNGFFLSMTSSIKVVIFCCLFSSIAASLISSNFVLKSINSSSTSLVSVSVYSGVWTCGRT